MDKTRNGNLKQRYWMQGKFGNFKNLNRGRTDMLEELDDVIIAKVLIFIIY